MKTIITKTIALVCCSLIFASAIAAQSKAQAWKFDEFAENVDSRFYSYYEEIGFFQRTERFIRQLRKERGKKVYIIYYHGRITEKFDETRLKNKIDRVQSHIQNAATPIKSEDILTIDGGYREQPEFEFWIAPPNAAPPPLTPTVDKSETFVCPNIAVYSNTPHNEAGTIYFSLLTDNFKDIDNYTPVWKVSGGEIVGGQGTDEIKVKLKDSAVKSVSAFVEINGLPLPCPKVSSTRAEIKEKIFQFDSVARYNYSSLTARIDSFLQILHNNPTAKGYVIVYASRSEGTKEMERAIRSVRNYLAFRNIDVSRITIVKGGYREYNTVDSWLIFDDAAPPSPTPTVDKRFVETRQPTKKIRPRK